MRARVRIRHDYESRNVSPGTLHRWHAGQEDILVWWEPVGMSEGIWSTDYDIDEAWFIPEEYVEVIEVLAP